MSDFKGHRNLGLLSSIVVMIVLLLLRHTIPIILTCGFITLLFSIFPDIDTKSTPSKLFYSLIIVYLTYTYIITKQYRIANLVAIISLIPQILTHRGILHSPITALVLPACVFIVFPGLYSIDINIIMYLSGVMGYMTHLILDRF